MQTLVIDTNGIVKKLEARGFSRTQAEGITEALRELDTSSLATKADLKDLRRDIEIAMSKQTVQLLTWITGMLLAQAALVVSLLQYLQ